MVAILIVEDDFQLGRLYSKTLTNAGHSIVQTTHCKQTLAQLQTFMPDIVLLDMSMSDGNGLIIIDYLHTHQQFCTTQIIIVSGNRQYEDRTQRQGVEYFLYKPVSPRMLIELIQRLMSVSTAS